MSTMTPGQMRQILDKALEDKVSKMFDAYVFNLATEIENQNTAKKTATQYFNAGMTAALMAWTIATEKHSPGV